MRLLLLLPVLFLAFAANAQTYPRYTNNAANKTVRDTVQAKPAALPEKPVAESIPVKPNGNFQDLMNKGVEQFKVNNYNGAIDFYTQALGVSTEEEAWRALTSRATVYIQMNRKDMAIKDFTAIIENGNLPEKKLAYIHLQRGRLEMEKNNNDLACADLKIAKQLGIPEMATFGFNCK